MPNRIKKATVFHLTDAAKNEIVSLAELAFRSDAQKSKRKWTDLFDYIEDIIDVVKCNCFSSDRKTAKEEKNDTVCPSNLST